MSIAIASLRALWARLVRPTSRKKPAQALLRLSHILQTALFACFEKCDQLIFRWQDWRHPPAHDTRQQS